MWTNHRGLKVAVDTVVKLYVNDVLAAEVVATPTELEYLAWGFLYVNKLLGAKVSIENSTIRIYADRDIPTRQAFLDCGPLKNQIEKVPKARRVVWSRLLELAREFSKLTMPAIEPQLAMHTAALYSGDKWVVAHDVSRHTAVLKLIGKALSEGIEASSSTAFTTGRVSGDVVTRLASLGVPVVMSLRGPLYSGVEAACRYGVVLVANVRSNGFAVLCGEEYVDFS